MPETQESERRRGIRELADSIQCLRDEFQEAMKDLKSDIAWREQEAKPILKAVNQTLWMVKGASLVITFLVAIGTWVFLQTNQKLAEVAGTAVINAQTLAAVRVLLENNQQNDTRQDGEIRELRQHRRYDNGN